MQITLIKKELKYKVQQELDQYTDESVKRAITAVQVDTGLKERTIREYLNITKYDAKEMPLSVIQAFARLFNTSIDNLINK